MLWLVVIKEDVVVFVGIARSLSFFVVVVDFPLLLFFVSNCFYCYRVKFLSFIVVVSPLLLFFIFVVFPLLLFFIAVVFCF